MPEDKLPIPQFAAKIKAKYPEYKDVNDTLLVKRIVEKYPEYKESVDLSGLEEPVKKKFGSEIGGKVGSSVGRLDVGAGITEIDEEGKPIGKALGKVSGITTPEQAKISRVNKAFGKIESFAGSREDFEEIYKQAPQEFDNLAKQVAPNVNKGEIDKFYTTETARKDAYVDRVLQSYNQQKTKAQLEAARNYRPKIDEAFSLTTPLLSKYTGKQYQLPQSEAQVSEILTDLRNEKEKLKTELTTNWNLSEVQTKAKELSEIEAAIRQNLTYQVGRMALERLSQNNPNVTSKDIGKEIFRVLHPDEYDLYEKVGGDKPVSFTVGTQRDTPVEADALNEQMVKLGNEIKRMYGNETAIADADIEEQTANRKFTFHKQARVKQKIAAILHERGLSPDKATVELMDKVADKYLNDEDRDIYYNHNKPNNNLDLPSTGLGYSLKNMYNEVVGNSVRTLLSPLLPGKDRARAASVLADMSESKELGEDPQSKARLDQLNNKVKDGFTLTENEKQERESLEKYTNIRSKWEKRFDLAGTGLGTILGMGTVSAFTGGLLNARNLPTAVKSLVAPSQSSMRGRLVTSALSFYESNAKNALREYPNDKDWLKRGLKAGLDTAVDSLTEMIFPEEKVLSGVGKRQVAKMVSNLTAENLTKTLNSNIFKDIARAMVGGSKRLIAAPAQEITEELIAATLKEAYDGAINPDPDRQALDLKQMVEIGESTLWSSSLLGVPKALFGGKSNKVPLNALWDSVSTQDGYITQKMTIERLKRDGELTEAEAKDRLDNLELGRNEYLNNPILSGDMGGLDAGQKQNYFARILNEAILKKQADAVTDPNLKKQYEQQIKESEAIREKIYKGEIKVTPENEELTKQEFEKKQKEQPTIDQDRVLGDEEVELTPEQKIIQQAIDNNEVEGMFLDMAKAALSDPQQAKQLLDEAKSQATGQVAGELGSARSGVEKAWGKTIADFVAPQEEAGSGGVGGGSKIAKRIRDNIKDLPEKDLGDAEANKNWNDIRESRKRIKSMSDEELLKEVQKGMGGKLINQAIYESYFGMDITAKDIETELQSLKEQPKAETPTPTDKVAEQGNEALSNPKSEGVVDGEDLSQKFTKYETTTTSKGDGFDYVRNKFSQTGGGSKRLSDKESIILNKNVDKLIERAEGENGVKRNDLKQATWKTNDGYIITEFFENGRGGTRIITPQGEEINVFNNKYKGESGQDISYFSEAHKAVEVDALKNDTVDSFNEKIKKYFGKKLVINGVEYSIDHVGSGFGSPDITLIDKNGNIFYETQKTFDGREIKRLPTKTTLLEIIKSQPKTEPLSNTSAPTDKAVEQPTQPQVSTVREEEPTPQPTKAKELADKVRKLKVDLGKLSGGGMQSNVLGLPVAIWNGAMDIVAKTIETGGTVADAIKRGLNYIQKNHRGQWNKKQFNDEVMKELGVRGITVNGEDLVVKDVDKEFAETINGFYSDLEQTILEVSPTDKGTPQAWLKKIGTGDEAKWTGVTDWLNSLPKDQKVTRKEILDWLKDNRIQVVEVVKGEVSNFTEDDIADVKINQHGAGNWVVKTKKDGTVEFPLDKADDKAEAIEYALEQLNYDNKSKRESKPKFQQYQIEGEKENYKEVLVTMPVAKSKQEYVVEQDYRTPNTFYAVNQKTGVKLKFGSYELAKSQAERLSKESQPDFDKQFKSSHFDEPNILVHLRMNTRTDADGNKVLFLEEIQGDFPQEYRKQQNLVNDYIDKNSAKVIEAFKKKGILEVICP